MKIAALLVLRGTMEVGIVGGLAYWGYHAASGTATRILLAIVAAAAGFGIWGAIDFRQAKRFSELLRLLEELVISGVAAGALYAAGQHTLGLALAALSLVYHAAVYLCGERLLKPETPDKNTANRLESAGTSSLGRS